MTCCELCLSILVVFSTIGFVLGIFIGLLYAVTIYGLYDFVLGFSIVFIIITALLIIGMWYWGKKRGKLEREMIEQSNEKLDIFILFYLEQETDDLDCIPHTNSY